MSVRWLSHSVAGLALFMTVGAALSLLPAGGAPLSHSPMVVPSPLGSSGTGHPLVANATCTVSVALVAIPSSVPLGQRVTLQTQVLFHPSSPHAVCTAPIGFVYTHLPIGCVTVSMPQLTCTARGPGIFVTAVHVYFPTMTLSASTTVTVFSP